MVRPPVFIPLLGAIQHTPALLAKVAKGAPCPLCKNRIGMAKGQEEIKLVCTVCDRIAPKYRGVASQHVLPRLIPPKTKPKPKPAAKKKTMTAAERIALLEDAHRGEQDLDTVKKFLDTLSVA